MPVYRFAVREMTEREVTVSAASADAAYALLQCWADPLDTEGHHLATPGPGNDTPPIALGDVRDVSCTFEILGRAG